MGMAWGRGCAAWQQSVGEGCGAGVHGEDMGCGVTGCCRGIVG